MDTVGSDRYQFKYYFQVTPGIRKTSVQGYMRHLSRLVSTIESTILTPSHTRYPKHPLLYNNSDVNLKVFGINFRAKLGARAVSPYAGHGGGGR